MPYQLHNIATTSAESITLYDLQRMVRATLEDRFDVPLWISAEISELKLNRSGHCYLNLVEKGATDGAPRAEARAVIWRSAYSTVASKFEAATHSRLCSGLKVLVRVIVTYHEVYGLSLQIVDIDPNYTLGEVERRRRETIARLQEDGVWDMNRELSLQRPTLRIAVISSATAAGYRDFTEELGRYIYRFTTTLFESTMQGDSAEESIIAALEHIASREEEFDVVAIIRGGGSTSDLALFDSYRIASHVAQFPIPIITGIGHDKDISVTDMVAYTMCKTPTAVATLLAEMADEELTALDNLTQQLHASVTTRISSEQLIVERATAELTRSTAVMLNGQRLRLDTAEERLCDEARARLVREHDRLTKSEEIVESRSPESILRQGFAIVRLSDGRAIDIREVIKDELLEIELHGGHIQSRVTNIRKNKA